MEKAVSDRLTAAPVVAKKLKLSDRENKGLIKFDRVNKGVTALIVKTKDLGEKAPFQTRGRCSGMGFSCESLPYIQYSNPQ